MKTQPKRGSELPPELTIYYLRGNHTARSLSFDIEKAIMELQDEWEQGWTHGMVYTSCPLVPAYARGRGLDSWPAFAEEVRAFYAQYHEKTRQEPGGCPVCGSGLTKIRGRHPGAPEREVCATCLQDRMDDIHAMSAPRLQTAVMERKKP